MMCSSNYEALHLTIFFSCLFLLFCTAVIPNLGYEPGHLGVSEKIE